jgi:energy-converting hydrogenase Eha subunit A
MPFSFAPVVEIIAPARNYFATSMTGQKPLAEAGLSLLGVKMIGKTAIQITYQRALVGLQPI